MDFSKATKQQLYEIATNDSNCISNRYAAAKEMQKRMVIRMAKKCKYPGCHREASKTWALVPLCKYHYSDIYQESYRYYNGKHELKVRHDERKHYEAIAHLTPWGKEW